MARGDRFHVSDAWPTGRVEENRAEAVVQLVANHTVIVGQSRSGKTTAARRLLEEILLWTDARIVLFDPNADFRWLNEVNPDSPDGDFRALWDGVRPHIKIATRNGGAAPWGIPWGKLSLDEMAAFLKLDPADTFAEYQHLRRHYAFEETRAKQKTQQGGGPTASDNDLGTIDEFKASQYFQIAFDDVLERYRLRLEKLSNRKAWASAAGNDLDSILKSEFRAAVIDLSVDDEEVRVMTVARALEVVWRQGEETRTAAMSAAGTPNAPWPGTLVVIDEAHLFAAPGPLDPQRRLVSERIERFSDQGKKFNLYLMLITQQPTKLNQRILAECNNRIILGMNERLSLRLLEDTYGGIRGRYDGALTFTPGEALLEGRLLCDETPPPSMPRGVRFIPARTREGGGAPPTDWAKPKKA